MKYWRSLVVVSVAFIARIFAADATKLGSASPDQLQFELALYFSPKPAVDPEAELRKLLADSGCRLQLANTEARRDVHAPHFFCSGEKIPCGA